MPVAINAAFLQYVEGTRREWEQQQLGVSSAQLCSSAYASVGKHNKKMAALSLWHSHRSLSCARLRHAAVDPCTASHSALSCNTNSHGGVPHVLQATPRTLPRLHPAYAGISHMPNAFLLPSRLLVNQKTDAIRTTNRRSVRLPPRLCAEDLGSMLGSSRRTFSF